MKNLVKIIPIFCSLIFSLLYMPMIQAQSSNEMAETNLDGDHFSLEGALDLFKKADSPEKFEALLNASDNNVNNLDLNEDGNVDYIIVKDHQEGDVHAIVMQVALNKSEMQDIAVIEIEKTDNDKAILQILGDENLYGEQLIVEPYDVEVQSQPDGNGGPSPAITTARIVVNVWLWPSVRYVYRPTYRVYASPYRWGHYPVYYKPWRPRPFKVFRSAIVYRPHCRVVHTHRVVRAHRVYTPRRRASVVVHKRTTTRIAARPKTTRVTTTKVGVKKTKQGTAIGKQKTTTTKVTGKRGNTVTKKTTTSTGVHKKGGKATVGKRHSQKAGVKTKNGKAGVKKTTTVGARKGKKGTTVRKKTTTTKVKRKH